MFRGYGVTIAALAAVVVPAAVTTAGAQPATLYPLLQQDTLVNADVWTRKPTMLAAGLGFVNIIGVPNADSSDLAVAQAAVQAVDGAWNVGMTCASGEAPPVRALTSAVSPAQVYRVNAVSPQYDSGLPVEFSWPVLPSTVDASDFRVTLNDGSVVTPDSASVNPNYEYNERSTVVLFGKFGNNIPSSDPASRFVTRVEVVADATPMRLVGPGGRIASAIGMSATKSVSPYDPPGADPTTWTGPRLVGGKISRMSTRGEQAPVGLRGNLPNHGRALYGSAAKFRVRVLTTGGFSPDGVTGLTPDAYRRHFQVIAVDTRGRRIPLITPGKTYRIDGAPLKVVGLADLGRKQSSYDSCYLEDHDNQIDIILDGSVKAARRVRFVRIPATGNGYQPLHNPGGPGLTPVQGVRYTSPGPRMVQRITNAIDRPMTVTYRRRASTGVWSPALATTMPATPMPGLPAG